MQAWLHFIYCMFGYILIGPTNRGHPLSRAGQEVEPLSADLEQNISRQNHKNTFLFHNLQMGWAV